ncbi:MAG: AAA family ATPase [Anaerolineae bacterium]
MRIKEVSIRKLFGRFNHTVPLNIDERITIMHGPNGFGKTVLLRLLDGVFRQNYSLLRKIPFEELRITFDNEKSLLVRQVPRGRKERPDLTISGSGPEERAFSPEATKATPTVLDYIESAAPELRRVGVSKWIDRSTDQALSLDDVLEKYGDLLPMMAEYRGTPPKWFQEIQSEVSTHIIQTNRLLSQLPLSRSARVYYERSSRASAASGAAVTQYATELAQRIQQTLAESGELSQSLDRTFPKRLVGNLSECKTPSLASDQIWGEIQALEEKRKRLMAAGLMDKSAESEVQISDQNTVNELNRTALSIYVKDGQEKLKVFDGLLEKIELLQKIINARFSYSYKQLAIDKQEGFVIRTTGGEVLPPDVLSSGEQHELVLFYGLLFRVDPGSLILIDEPELSLHIAWQQEFLKDLLAVTNLANIDILIATHSADIIYDRWDLTVALEGPNE